MKRQKGQPALVSAVITTFNRQEMAKRAVRSAVVQSYRPIEIIVVEDGSNSGVEEWLQEEGLKHVRYVRHESRRGLGAARNTGFRKARGEYVAYLDDDDEWMPEKLAKQIERFDMESDICGVVYCAAIIISSQGEMIEENRPRLSGDIKQAIHERGLFTIPSSCVFRKEAIERVGGYDEAISSHIDHDIWLQLARENYACTYVDECLVKVYQHLGYTMTEDHRARVRATQQFCDKWEQDFLRWFGPTDGKRYCFRFRGRVMAMLGWAFFGKRERRQASKYFLLALRYDWQERNYYEGLVASIIGTSLWERFLKAWKQFKDWKE